MLESNRVLQMDCMDFMREHDGKFDLILADPPYAHGMDFGNDSDVRNIPKWADWMEQWMRLGLGCLKDGGCMYVYGWNENMCYVMHRFPHETFRYLQWHRHNGQISPKNWVRSHECIVQVWNEGDKPVMYLDNMREPYADNTRAGTKSEHEVKSPYSRLAKPGGKLFREYHKDGRYGTDVMYYSVVRTMSKDGTPDGGGFCKTCDKLYEAHEGKTHWKCETVRHPTQKPMGLSTRLIRSKCDGLSDRLYIPFSGSGAECVAARRLAVTFYATEITPDYVYLGNRRLAWEGKREEFNDPANFELGATLDVK